MHYTRKHFDYVHANLMDAYRVTTYRVDFYFLTIIDYLSRRIYFTF